MEYVLNAVTVPLIFANNSAASISGPLGSCAGTPSPERGAPTNQQAASYLGRAACPECHEREATLWRGSDHDLAMQEVSEESVLGDFDDAEITHFGVTSRFFKRGESFFVRTDGADGRMTEYEVAYTFGVAPLQQYLIEFPGQRYQALSLAWDSRSVDDGGQRWFHLYPNEAISHDDELPLYANLADLYRMQDREDQAERVLRAGLARSCPAPRASRRPAGKEPLRENTGSI